MSSPGLYWTRLDSKNSTATDADTNKNTIDGSERVSTNRHLRRGPRIAPYSKSLCWKLKIESFPTPTRMHAL